jgi:hypothetical protein
MKKETSLYIWVVAITILTSIITTFATYNVITTYFQKNTQFTSTGLSSEDDTANPWGDSDGDGVPNTYDNCNSTPGPSCNLGCPATCTGVIVFPTQPPATTTPTAVTTTIVVTQTTVPTVGSTNPTTTVNPTQKPVNNSSTPQNQSTPTPTQSPDNGIIAALKLTTNFTSGQKYTTTKDKETVTGSVSTGGITLTIKVNASEKTVELGGSQQFMEEIALTDGPNIVTITAFDPGTKQREEVTFTIDRNSTQQTTSTFKMDIGTGILIVTIITLALVATVWAFIHFSMKKGTENE